MGHLSVREIIARPLRGRYNSVRYRFLTLPSQRTRLVWYRLSGRSWIDFYRDYMDKNVAQLNERPISDTYRNAAKDHLDVLKELGLRPGHRVLDVGCGILRTALYLIPYIGPGNYIGTEISPERVARGRKLLLDPSGISPQAYKTVIINSNELHELTGTQLFDYIWANSVFTHMPFSDVRALLRAAKSLLKEEGQFVFTYTAGEHVAQTKIKDFSYPEAIFRKECEAAGFKYEVLTQFKHLTDFGHPRTRLVRLVKVEPV